MPQQILNQLTKEKLQGFVKYLQDAGQMNTTVSKYMSYVRWFLRWACNNGYYNGLLHEQYKPRFKGIDCKEVIFPFMGRTATLSKLSISGKPQFFVVRT